MSELKKEDLVHAFNDLFEYLDKKFTEIDDRFEQVDSRFEAVESRLGKVESRLGKVESRLDKVETRLDKVEGHLEKMDKRFDQNVKEHKLIHSRLILIENGIQKLHLQKQDSQSFGRLENRVSGLETDVGVLKRAVSQA